LSIILGPSSFLKLSALCLTSSAQLPFLSSTLTPLLPSPFVLTTPVFPSALSPLPYPSQVSFVASLLLATPFQALFAHPLSVSPATFKAIDAMLLAPSEASLSPFPSVLNPFSIPALAAIDAIHRATVKS
jgi:hypothetical protein